jgi:polysaccharide biosynthesis protein PslH
MRILTISSRIPDKNGRGDQKVSFYRIDYLIKCKYLVELVCFENKKSDLEAKKILQKKGVRLHLIKFNIIEIFFSLIKSIFDKNLPFQCALYKSKKFTEKVKSLYKSKNFKAIYCIMVRVAPNISWYKGILFLEMIDSLGLNFTRRFLASKGIKKLFFYIESQKIAKYEKKLANRSQKSFITSEIDKKKIESPQVEVIPLGTDIYQKPRRYSRCPKIIFSGNMFYKPNIDAIIWFSKYCWNDILNARPDSKLIILGSNPDKKVISLKKNYSSIIITGRVSSVYNVLSKATVSIAPMLNGSGMQSKILESMACAIPVITTQIGLGDIKAKINYDLLVADTPAEFVKKIILLINSKKINKKIGINGQRYVLKNHNWDNLNKKFINLCKF